MSSLKARKCSTIRAISWLVALGHENYKSADAYGSQLLSASTATQIFLLGLSNIPRHLYALRVRQMSVGVEANLPMLLSTCLTSSFISRECVFTSTYGHADR